MYRKKKKEIEERREKKGEEEEEKERERESGEVMKNSRGGEHNGELLGSEGARPGTRGDFVLQSHERDA